MQVKYTDLFDALLAAWNRRTALHLHLCSAKLYELIFEIQRDSQKQYQNPKTHALAARGKKRLKENLSNPEWTLASLCAELGISAEYFRKIFARMYGISPKAYLLCARIERAKQLLLSKELTVSAIGKMCGYLDESYFCREFKRLCGQTPTEFAQI